MRAVKAMSSGCGEGRQVRVAVSASHWDAGLHLVLYAQTLGRLAAVSEGP